MCEKAHVVLTCTPLGDQNIEGSRCSWQTRIISVGAQDEVLLENDEGLDLAPEVEHFFECVDNGCVPETDGETARKVSAVVLDAYHRAAIDRANV